MVAATRNGWKEGLMESIQLIGENSGPKSAKIFLIATKKLCAHTPAPRNRDEALLKTKAS